MVSSDVESLPALLTQQAALFGRYPELAVVYLFGSVARGTWVTRSDVDLGLVFQRRGGTALQHHRLLGDLASRLEPVTHPHPVDLVVLEDQGPVFCRRVLGEARLLYEADRARRLDFESEVYIRALDFYPTYQLATRGRIQGLRRWLNQVSG